MDVCPVLMQPGRLDCWMAFFKQILETNGGPEFETPTNVPSEIDKLDQTPFWKLKAIVS